MEFDAEQLLNDLVTGMSVVGEEAPELAAAFVQMDNAAYVEGELERKTKELIGIGIAVATRCQYCICIHLKQGLDEGATREEILEAAAVGVAFGGSPAMAYVASTLIPALDQLEA
jgi:AhpD family alkylhydroperoxidase